MRILLAMAFVMAACATDGDQCDPDEKYSAGLCFEIDTGQFSHFGDVCTADSECKAPTTLCEADGYCTTTGCGTNEDCPVYWTCEGPEGGKKMCVQH